MSSNYVQWGHVQTTDVNGGPLLLVFALKTQDEIDELQADLINQVAVLRSFAAHWNMGYQVLPAPTYIHQSLIHSIF